MKKCPRDGASLEEEKIGRVSVDSCPQCEGTFLDSMELGQVLGMSRDLAVERLLLDDIPPLRCSHCDARMAAKWFSQERTVMLDVCPACHGVWLDGGELKGLLKEIYGL